MIVNPTVFPKTGTLSIANTNFAMREDVNTLFFERIEFLNNGAPIRGSSLNLVNDQDELLMIVSKRKVHSKSLNGMCPEDIDNQVSGNRDNGLNDSGLDNDSDMEE
ncbi:hypothetical protein Tco_1374315, partial [Tanacetum coccineum]